MKRCITKWLHARHQWEDPPTALRKWQQEVVSVMSAVGLHQNFKLAQRNVGPAQRLWDWNTKGFTQSFCLIHLLFVCADWSLTDHTDVCWLKPYRPHRGVLTEALLTTQMCADWSPTDHTDVCWLKPYWPHRDLGQNFSILCFYQMLKKYNTQQLPLVFWHMCLTKISHIFFWDQTGLKCECLHWLCQYKW